MEIGQGSRTVLTQAVAEEMRIAPEKVRVIMGDTALVPDDGGTWASLTTPMLVPLVRKAAAAARKAGLTPPRDWTVLGTSLADVRGREIVTGALRYACDVVDENALFGRVIRPPGMKATLERVDAAAAERMPGVIVVRDGNLVGVVAKDRAAAERAARAIRAEWKTEPVGTPQFKEKSQPPDPKAGGRYPPLIAKGDAQAALAAAEQTHESAYTLGYVSHVALETRSAIAEWSGERLTVRTGTQVPFVVRRQLASAFRIPEENIRIISSDVGGGFGCKHSGECEVEAARLAKSAGKPVRLEWSREEEFSCGYARPAGLVEVRSGFTASGKLTAWDFHNYNSGPSGLGTPYAMVDSTCAFHRSESPLRQGAYRSLAAVANTFARESHVDEVATRLKQDPVEFRLRNLADARTREVVERAAERFGWSQRKGACGMACNLEKDAHLALFAELEIRGALVKVRRMVIAFDPGAVLNPGNLRNQIEGALVQGIGGALFEELKYDARGIRNGRLSAYRVPRFSDMPDIDVILVDRREITAAGAGESPITVVAPALANALFAGTGRRVRRLPLLG
jgi:isoquinoline 1-oxidoreductase